MTSLVDLGPAARRLAELVEGVPEGALDGATPSGEYSLGDLLQHIERFAVVFAAAARKESGEIGSVPPSGDAALLPDDWRVKIPQDLTALADAWTAPEAWTGRTKAGGAELPGEIAGLVALDELVVHAWDVARATGQPYEPDRPTLEVVYGFVQQFAPEGEAVRRKGLFGPVVDVAEEQPLLDRLVGFTGRDPAWTP